MNLSFRCSSLATSVNEAAVSGLSRFCRNTQEQRSSSAPDGSSWLHHQEEELCHLVSFIPNCRTCSISTDCSDSPFRNTQLVLQFCLTHQVVSFPGSLQTQVRSVALQGLQAGYLGPHLQGLLWREAFDQRPSPPPGGTRTQTHRETVRRRKSTFCVCTFSAGSAGAAGDSLAFHSHPASQHRFFFLPCSASNRKKANRQTLG